MADVMDVNRDPMALLGGKHAVLPNAPGIARPTSKRWRLFYVYSVTFLVVGSYLWLKLQSKVRTAESFDVISIRTHIRNARRIERAISRLQGLFIKVGQLISIMTNFLPEEFRAQLAGLQDAVPARPYEDIERRIREEFGGKGPRELFAELSEKPVASASIGQVHAARTHDGRRVAVKVQYPDIEEIVRIDLRTMKWIFGVIEWFLPAQNLAAVYREIREMILQELDFQLEAAHIDRISANFRVGGKEREDVGFPVVLSELSTTRVLTTEWIDGVKVSDRVKLDALGVDRSQLARTVVTAYCQQIFKDGVYHADPHPGNLLVQATPSGPRVMFLDFGAVAEVSPRMRRGIIDLIQAGIARDTPKLIQAMKDMGFIARGADPAIFDRVVDVMHERFQEEVKLDSFSLKDIKFDPQAGLERLADLRRMDLSLRDLTEHFHVPKEWIMLERTVLLLMGLCTDLDRELNPMEVIRPYLEEFVVGKDRDFSALVVETTRDVALSAVALPGELKKFLARTMRGELEVRFKGIDEHARTMYVLGHQLIYAALGLSGAIFWLVLDGRGQAVEAAWALRGAGVFGGVLAISFLFNRPKSRRRR